ncbi:RHS repeat-associated core domain-containing protein [Segnochrobactraceae bacterium EtOH-i3]
MPDTAATDPDWQEDYFDGLGRSVKTRQRGPSASKPILVDRTYLPRGDLGSETAPYYEGDPTYSTKIVRDFANREILRTFPGIPSRTITTAYLRPSDSDPQEAFNRVIVTDENGHKTSEAFGAFETPVRRLGFRSSGNTGSVSTLITWDRLGRLFRGTDPIGANWDYRWDGLSRRTRIEDPDAGTRTFAYDDASRLIAENNELSEITRYNYDAAGRVLKRTERAGTAQAAVATFVYDEVRSGAFNIGHRTTATYGDVIERTNFDALGRQILQQYEVSGAGTFNARTAYDAAGRILYRTWPDGTSTGTASDPWLYDDAGRLRFVRGLLSEASYDASDRPVLSRTLEVETTWTYDPNRGWPTAMTVRNRTDNVVFLSRIYNRDGTGRLTSVNAQGTIDDWTYTYDWLYRLIRADNAGDDTADRSWTYDDAGRIVTSNKLGTYTYATGTHRVTKTSVGSREYKYDSIGSLVEGSTSEKQRNIYYDGGGRLDKVVLKANNNETITSLFVYDADGRRVRRTLSGGTSNDTLYLGDVEISPATASGTGAASRSVTVYPYPGARVVTTQTRAAGATTWVTGASTWLTMHRDTLKSVSAESFASGTNVNTLARRTLYAPYGETLSEAAWNNAPADSKGWIGERAEPDSGLIYLNARWYDPSLSRFTRPDKLDPIIPGVGPDQYGYAGGDPINNSDPGGEFAFVFAAAPALLSADAMVALGGLAVGLWGGRALVDFIKSEIQSENPSGEQPSPTPELDNNPAAATGGLSGDKNQDNKSSLDKSKNDSRSNNISKNRENGKLAEIKAVEDINNEGHDILGVQVGVKTDQGLRVVDVLYEDKLTGEYVAAEVKSGGASRSKAQKAKDLEIETKGGALTSDKMRDRLGTDEIGPTRTEERRY